MPVEVVPVAVHTPPNTQESAPRKPCSTQGEVSNKSGSDGARALEIERAARSVGGVEFGHNSVIAIDDGKGQGLHAADANIGICDPARGGVQRHRALTIITDSVSSGQGIAQDCSRKV